MSNMPSTPSSSQSSLIGRMVVGTIGALVCAGIAIGHIIIFYSAITHKLDYEEKWPAGIYAAVVIIVCGFALWKIIVVGIVRSIQVIRQKDMSSAESQELLEDKPRDFVNLLFHVLLQGICTFFCGVISVLLLILFIVYINYGIYYGFFIVLFFAVLFGIFAILSFRSMLKYIKLLRTHRLISGPKSPNDMEYEEDGWQEK